ncbi:MAG: glycosyltransferase, partial [Chitinophagaceae bacterium]
MNSLLLQLFWLVYVLVAGIQIFYYLYFFSRLAGYKTKEGELPEKDNLPLSVIICAKNEERNLQRNLPEILQQHYTNSQHDPQFEVVVVDDNSDDDTSSVLRYLSPGYPHFHFVELHQSAKGIPGKKYPLTIGIKKSANDILVLTDADCKPAGTHWLELIAGKFNNGTEVVLGYGAYKTRPGLLNKVIRFETFFSAMQYLSFALAGIPYMGVGRNLAYKKELF